MAYSKNQQVIDDIRLVFSNCYSVYFLNLFDELMM